MNITFIEKRNNTLWFDVDDTTWGLMYDKEEKIYYLVDSAGDEVESCEYHHRIEDALNELTVDEQPVLTLVDINEDELDILANMMYSSGHDENEFILD